MHSHTNTLSALPDRLKLPLRFDAAALAADVAAIAEEDWIPHYVTQNYEGGWSVIPLRCKAGATHPVMMAYADPTATEFMDTPWLESAPHLRATLAAFHCPLAVVRLMRLEPGSLIKPHTDMDLDAEMGSARIHVPITTNPDVEFLLNDRRVEMEPGSAWYLRLADTHAISNRGQNTRVHLVIDCTVDSWLEDQLLQAAQSA